MPIHHHQTTTPTRKKVPCSAPRTRPAATQQLRCSSSAPVTGSAVATATPPEHGRWSATPELTWIECGDGLQCATASVPLDHDRPAGRQISLSLARLPAGDQTNRIGTLFVNNGGPGNSVIEFMHGDVRDVVPQEVQDRFDIVGFDPRGVGESTPVRCFTDAAEQQAFFGELPPFPVTPAEITQATNAAEQLGRRCRDRNSDLLDHVSTADVARDLDLLRRAVGDDQLTFAGYSYGGLIGLTYAQLYPQRVRAALLDATPDPVAWTTGRGADRRDPFSVRLASHEAASGALGAFLDQCQAAGPQRCAFASSDTRAKFDGLMARLLEGPITVDLPPGPAGPGGPTPLTYAFVVDGLRGGLQFPPIWSDLAGLLEATSQAAQAPPAVAPVDDVPAGPAETAPPSEDEAADVDGVRQQPRGIARRQLLGEPQPEQPPPLDRRGSRGRPGRSVLRRRLRLAVIALRHLAGPRP